MRPRPLSRRQALTGSILMPMAAGFALPAGAGQSPAGGEILVACFSHTGNTRVIAGQIRRASGADIFAIEPAEPYPEDYEATVRQAQRERDGNYEPPLRATIGNIAGYRIVYLGFPIWGMTAPSVIRSFLSAHDLAGKTLVPFITHGGYGLGQSLTVLSRHAPKARLIEGLTMQADQERDTLAQVTSWLGAIETGGRK
jgi:flavodoxin